MIKIALLGYGTIGSGVAKVLETNQKSIAAKAGSEIEIKYILDLRKFPGDPNEDKVISDYQVIVNDPEVQIVVEAMGGEEPAHTFAKQALEAGKHFATSNKALVARYGAELLAIAAEKNVNFFFEASVGGGIPIIRSMNTCLTADEILEITGILNGTTNYMMTCMAEDGSEFADALKDAQAKGYAEADPSADIEGYDACRKIAILTSLAAGRQMNYEDIPTEGIVNISAADIRYAAKLGRTIRLLATSRKTEDGYLAMVAPFMLLPEHPLSTVKGVFNAVFVKGNMLGDAMFYGAGAGSLPTASAVVADVIDIARNLDRYLPVAWEPEAMKPVDSRYLNCRNFVRTDKDRAAVEAAFGEVSFVEPEAAGETAFVTAEMDGFAYEAAAEKLGGVINRIRLG